MRKQKQKVNHQKSLLGIMGSLLVAVIVSACSVLQPQPTPTTTPIPPTRTPVPPTATSTAIPTATTLPTEVIVLVSPEAMDVFSSWDATIRAFTPADNPVTDLSGLSASEIGFWNNSYLGWDLYDEVVGFLSAVYGSKWEDGLYACPDLTEAFSSCSLRIYFTDASITKMTGAAAVIFQSNP
jgi:hypothetical protein